MEFELRPWRMEDAETIARYANNPKVAAFDQRVRGEALQVAVDGGQRQGWERRLHLCKDVFRTQRVGALAQDAQHGFALFGVFHSGAPFKIGWNGRAGTQLARCRASVPACAGTPGKRPGGVPACPGFAASYYKQKIQNCNGARCPDCRDGV